MAISKIPKKDLDFFVGSDLPKKISHLEFNWTLTFEGLKA